MAYKFYKYDPKWFNGRDPRKMSPREVFDVLYGKDSEYNPYSQRYYTNTATTTTTTNGLYQNITRTTTGLGLGMTTTGTLPLLYQTIIYEDESRGQHGFIYTGKDLIMDVDDWYDIVKGGAMLADGVKVEIRDGKAIVYGKEGAGRILSGLKGRWYLPTNPLIQEFTTEGGAAKGVIKGMKYGVWIPVAVDYYNYATGQYNNTLDFQADLGKDLTVWGSAGLTGAGAMYGANSLAIYLTGAACPPALLAIIGGGVTINAGIALDNYFGSPLFNFYRDRVIPGVNNFINRVKSFIESIKYYFMEKTGQVYEA